MKASCNSHLIIQHSMSGTVEIQLHGDHKELTKVHGEMLFVAGYPFSVRLFH